MSEVARFYRGGKDARGRTLSEIWSWPAERLENSHDYIQWLFPLRERSVFNLDAPLMDNDDVAAFHTDVVLQASLRRSLDVMLHFYGLERNDRGIARGENFAVRAAVWLTPHNHNHLRLTRILKSLRLFGLDDDARALFEALEAIYCGTSGRISAVTYQFWKDAMH